MAWADWPISVPRMGWLAQERARPQRVRTWPHAWRWAVATVCFGAFMGQLDASVVTLTYRPVELEFHAGLAAVEWVSLAYLLTLIALLVPVGRLSDARGRKLLYLYGFVVFTAASVACGLAPSLALLIGFRSVQALGAAMLQANSVALVTSSAPAGRRRHALGVQAGAQALGLALGPSVGGILVSTVGWRWVYFINVPVGLIALVGGHYLLPRTRQRSRATSLDRTSVVLLTIATPGLLLGLSGASGLSVTTEVTVAALGLAAIAGSRFVGRQRRSANPLIDPMLFREPAIRWGLLAAMCGYLVLFGPLVLVPIALTSHGGFRLDRRRRAHGPARRVRPDRGSRPRALPSWLHDRQRAMLGAGICSVALAAALAANPTPAVLVFVLAALGLGLGVFAPSNNNTIMGAAPPQSVATVGGLLNLARGLGTALGVAAVTLAFHLGSDQRLAYRADHLALVMLLAATLVVAISSRLSTNENLPRGSSRPGNRADIWRLVHLVISRL